MAEKKFVDGVYANRPHEKAPDFVKAHLSINTEQFLPFLTANTNAKGYLNLDILESKDGTKWYMTVNEYEPKPREETKEESDIPF